MEPVNTPATPAVTPSAPASPAAPATQSVEQQINAALSAAMAETPVNGVDHAAETAPVVAPAGAQEAPTPERPRGPDGRFLPAGETPAPAPAPAPPPPAEPVYNDPEYGPIPLSELPEFLKAREEFVRNAAANPLSKQTQTLEQQLNAERAALAAERARAAEAQEILNQMVYLGQSDPDGLMNFLRSPAIAGGARPPQAIPQAAPQQPVENKQYMTRQEVEAMLVQQRQQAVAEQQRAQRVAEITNGIDQLLNREFPKEQFGEAQEMAWNAVSKFVDLETQRGGFPENLPLPLAMKKISAICARVRSGFNSLMTQRAAQQAAITASVPPPMVGGATPMPRTTPEGPKPFNRQDVQTQLQNRLEALSRGLI